MNFTRPLPIMDKDFKVAATIPLLVLGTIGNILTLCVLQRRAFTNKSYAVFLRSLAVADFLTLWAGKATAEAFVGGDPIMYPTEWLKRLHLGPWVVVSMVSSWTLMMISVERMIIVYKPHKAQVLCTKKSACIAVAVVWSFIGLSMLINCIVSTRPFDLGAVQLIYYGILYLYIPGTIMVTCNLLVVIRLRRASVERKKMVVGEVNSESNKVTIMLVINSFAFIILTLPHLVLMTTWPFVPSARNLALYSFLYVVGRLNHAINFLLYCLSGALFRKEVRLMFLVPLKALRRHGKDKEVESCPLPQSLSDSAASAASVASATSAISAASAATVTSAVSDCSKEDEFTGSSEM